MIYQILEMMKLTFYYKKRFHGGREIRTQDEGPMVLPTTPFGKASVRWATGKRLTNRLPKLSPIKKLRGIFRSRLLRVLCDLKNVSPY